MHLFGLEDYFVMMFDDLSSRAAALPAGIVGPSRGGWGVERKK